MAAKPEDIMGDGSILKTVIKPGTGEEKPAWGNKVKVHYVGTLTNTGEKFESSRDRDSPFDFQVGSGVITGWSEAVPTMLLGEIAKFTISSEKAYGPGGSPPKIPPNASLDFEIELLSFTDREDVLQDGTLMKKQLGKPEEDSWVTPNANCDLEFKLTIAGGDQHDVSWPSGSGCPHGLPPRLREGLFEMRKGETCSFLLPKDAPGVDYEVTLVSWVENEECVSGDDGAVVKRIERDKTVGKDDWKWLPVWKSNFMAPSLRLLDGVEVPCHLVGFSKCAQDNLTHWLIHTGARTTWTRCTFVVRCGWMATSLAVWTTVRFLRTTSRLKKRLSMW